MVPLVLSTILAAPAFRDSAFHALIEAHILSAFFHSSLERALVPGQLSIIHLGGGTLLHVLRSSLEQLCLQTALIARAAIADVSSQQAIHSASLYVHIHVYVKL